MVVVTINILVKHLLLCVELVLDAKSVLLLPEELVESVEARREAKKNKYKVFVISTCIAWQYAAMLFTSELAPFLSCDGPIKYVKTLQRILLTGFGDY